MAASILRDNIRIISLDGMGEMQGYMVRLETLIHCIEGTIPGSRGFGLRGDYLDAPINVAESDFAAELQEKADIYIPEISIDEVMSEASLDGTLETTIKVERRAFDD